MTLRFVYLAFCATLRLLAVVATRVCQSVGPLSGSSGPVVVNDLAPFSFRPRPPHTLKPKASLWIEA
jgi:hypothetical protein